MDHVPEQQRPVTPIVRTTRTYERYRDLFRPNDSETQWVIAAYLMQHLDEFVDWLASHSPKHTHPCVNWVNAQGTTLLDAQRLLALSSLTGTSEHEQLDQIRKKFDAINRAELYGEREGRPQQSLDSLEGQAKPDGGYQAM